MLFPYRATACSRSRAARACTLAACGRRGPLTACAAP
ncbi:lipoprotein [Variovorax sp.]